MENYKPSAEEISQAEERMTKTQEELTKDREKMFSALEKMGKTGYLEISGELVKEGFAEIMKGIIDNHLVHISVLREKDHSPNYTTVPRFPGYKDFSDNYIDGEKISSVQATNIFNKFKEIAIQDYKIQKADLEVWVEADKSVNSTVDKILS
ncbi:MAG: hypothetical protein PHE24_06960 [Patescibacteria group bacterium]|nr:hypothetical protein [Patescibacteria group bacterium]